jgi:ankyrin repeat protein
MRIIVISILFELLIAPTVSSNINNDLIRAVKLGKLSDAKILVAQGASLLTTDENGRSPLHIACEKDFMNIVTWLLVMNLRLDARDADGLTPLHTACSEGNLDVVSLLVDHGVSVNLTDNYGNSPLLWAAYKGHLSVVTYLYQKGANLEVHDLQGNTPLHQAAYANRSVKMSLNDCL